jgi:uncharacterized protein (TIGR03435 family)
VKSLTLLILGIAVVAIPIFSQTPAGGTAQFDVASIKVHPPPITRIIVQAPPGRFLAEAFNLKMLVGWAYGLPETRVVGGPSWVESDRYDVEGKADGTIQQGQLPLMLLSLLEDRFQLKSHKETRELPAYELVVARGGSKLKLSEDQTPPAPPVPGGPAGAGPRGGPTSASSCRPRCRTIWRRAAASRGFFWRTRQSPVVRDDGIELSRFFVQTAGTPGL